MDTTKTCQQTGCAEDTAGGYCAFHHLAFVSGPDTFSGLLDEVGGLGEEAILGVLFDLVDVEPAPDLLCWHDARLGDCYLTEVAEFPGMARNPWELRAAAYSLGIPLN